MKKENNPKIVVELTTDIQEVTLRAEELGLVRNLEVKYDDRREVLGILAKWAIEFNRRLNNNPLAGNFYYDLLDQFLGEKENFMSSVMDSNNGHKPELVNTINRMWEERGAEFRPILCALYARDIDEITDADSFQLDRWNPEIGGDENVYDPDIAVAYWEGQKNGDWTEYNRLALRDMEEDWSDYANNYLTHIADDWDLEAILAFLRVKPE